jgi:hypothetical protein
MDNEDDALLFERMREYVIEHYPNPGRVGCLDRETLEKFVFSPKQLDLTDVRYLHIMKCAECTRELGELRRLRDLQKREARFSFSAFRTRHWIGLAASLSIIAILTLVVRMRLRQPRTASAAKDGAVGLGITIDLSQYGTRQSGSGADAKTLRLPRKRVNLHMILPYFSPGGPYAICVAEQAHRGAVKVRSQAIATETGSHTELSVILDLQILAAGRYCLSTFHEGDSAPYYYPVVLQ